MGIVRGEQTHVLDVAPTANVEALRAQLSLLEGVDAEQLNLFCSGAPLEDEVSLAFLKNQAIDLTIPLKGGKVHGSLSCWKGQRPDPQGRSWREEEKEDWACKEENPVCQEVRERCRDFRRPQEGTQLQL